MTAAKELKLRLNDLMALLYGNISQIEYLDFSSESLNYSKLF